MKTVIVDTETDGFLDQLTQIHSLCFHHLETGEDISDYSGVESSLRFIMTCDEVWFHNAWGFDIWAIKKVFPWFSLPISKVKDSLILSQLMLPHLYMVDARAKAIPRHLWGRHALEAWGHRYNLHKGDYMKDMEAKGLDPWAEWNPEMQAYCDRDVEITTRIVKDQKAEGIPEKASELEHWFKYLCVKMQDHGFLFDVEKAEILAEKLRVEIAELDKEIIPLVPQWYVSSGEFIPKKTSGEYTKGCALTKIRLKTFNPNSRDQVADRMAYLFGWVPTEFTETGKHKVDEGTLKTLNNPVGDKLSKRFLVAKRYGMLLTGKQSWVNSVHPDGRLRGKVNPMGARTRRCTHSIPNMAQVPSEAAFRELFKVRPGYKLVGSDASGIELRCLAHRMAKYDDGEYIDVILNGDVHSVNACALFDYDIDEFMLGRKDKRLLIERAGEIKGAGEYLKSLNPGSRKTVEVYKFYDSLRDLAKTFIYAFLYGAGDAKIGSIVGGGASEGKALKDQFIEGLPALGLLQKEIEKQARSGFLECVDGAKILTGPKHAVLNTRLQSDGGLLCKWAAVLLFRRLTKEGFIWGEDWAMVAHVHDEYQLEVKEKHCNYVAEVAVWAFQQSGRDFNWLCPLDGEAKIGNNWAETH